MQLGHNLFDNIRMLCWDSHLPWFSKSMMPCYIALGTFWPLLLGITVDPFVYCPTVDIPKEFWMIKCQFLFHGCRWPIQFMSSIVDMHPEKQVIVVDSCMSCLLCTSLFACLLILPSWSHSWPQGRFKFKIIIWVIWLVAESLNNGQYNVCCKSLDGRLTSFTVFFAFDSFFYSQHQHCHSRAPSFFFWATSLSFLAWCSTSASLSCFNFAQSCSHHSSFSDCVSFSAQLRSASVDWCIALAASVPRIDTFGCNVGVIATQLCWLILSQTEESAWGGSLSSNSLATMMLSCTLARVGSESHLGCFSKKFCGPLDSSFGVGKGHFFPLSIHVSVQCLDISKQFNEICRYLSTMCLSHPD